MRRARLLLGLFAVACGDLDNLNQTVANVTVAPTVNFGGTHVGWSATASLVIRARGNGRTHIAGIRTDRDDLDIAAVSKTLNPGDTWRVRLTWTPTAVGPLEDLMIVTTDVVGAETWGVQLSGMARLQPDCEDNNPCTTDRFTGEICRHDPREGSCDDDNSCTTFDTCNGGSCVGVGRNCDDDNDCTLNLCDPANGCIFPKNPDICVDGDPCTADVCDPIGGCSNPEAQNGTPCGPFDCAVGHLCFFGRCEEIDIVTETEGLPCNDANSCTGPDVCGSGICIGGPATHTDPEIVKTFETFGGQGSFVATDGHVYLFADADALRFAIRSNGDDDAVVANPSDGGLIQTARLDLRARIAPVTLSSGHFVVAHDDRLAVIDSSDPWSPQIIWDQEIALWGIPWSTRLFAHMAAVHGGVVVGSPEPDWEDCPESHTCANIVPGPYFIPIGDATNVGTPAAIDETIVPVSPSVVVDLDACGSHVAWTDGYRVHWAEIDLNGEIHNRGTYTPASPPWRVSVTGSSVAILDTQGRVLLAQFGDLGTAPQVSTIEWVSTQVPSDLTIHTPACATVFGDCRVEDEDWAAMPNVIHVATAAGIFGIATDYTWDTAPAEIPTAPPEPVLMSWLVDPMPTAQLDHGPGHLLAHGVLALPLLGLDLDSSVLTNYARVSGPLHGDVAAIVDVGGNVVVAGAMAIGSIDLDNLTINDWTISSVPTTEARPRIIKGDNMSSSVQRATQHQNPCADGPYSVDGDPVNDTRGRALETCTCTAVDLWERASMDRLDSPLNQLYQVTPRLCRLLSGSFDAAQDTLWAFTGLPVSAYYVNVDPLLSVWSLGDGPRVPIHQIHDPFMANYATSANGRWPMVRAADNGKSVAVFAADLDRDSAPGGPEFLNVHIYSNETSSIPQLDTGSLMASVPIRDWSMDQWPDARDRFGLEWPCLMIGQPDHIELWTMALDADGITAPQSVPLGDAHGEASGPVRIPWMRDGTAWASWDWIDNAATGPTSAEPSLLPTPLPTSQHRLTQITYDGFGVEELGSVTLPRPARRVLDHRDLTVVTTDTAIHIVAPACR
ncbi:MAG: hypothetical protein A2341_06105 [Deltaproteobacteria bacterium RIFOXYB12_FULL_58_9]|nr:MAG: hypothetical protein A2341_06105 [Deltaproteobacteria bacterium RIFOXYB12_FULL_58_9]